MRVLIPAIVIGAPILEIVAFIFVSDLFGLGPTIIIIIVTATIGLLTLRHQGLQIIHQLQKEFRGGYFPMREVFDGFCIFLGGIFMLIPGFITDVLAVLLFLPPLRRSFGHFLKSRYENHWAFFGNNTTMGLHSSTKKNKMPKRTSEPSIIDGEYKDMTESPNIRDENLNSRGTARKSR